MPNNDDAVAEASSEGDPEVRALFDTLQQLHERLSRIQPDGIISAEFGNTQAVESGGAHARAREMLREGEILRRGGFKNSFHKDPPGTFCNVYYIKPDTVE